MLQVRSNIDRPCLTSKSNSRKNSTIRELKSKEKSHLLENKMKLSLRDMDLKLSTTKNSVDRILSRI